MINRLVATTIVFSALFSCSEDEKLSKPEEIVGQWVVKDVIYDGIQQTAWNGAHLTFQQNALNGGIYSMHDTPYDTVWAASGSWTRSLQPSEVILNDSVTASFQVKGDELIIAMLLPWTAQQLCADGICITLVSGDWMFKFQRVR
jgi:hypothetical protein